MNINQQSLQQALEYTRCRELPRQWRESDNTFWVSAIILIKKRNGDYSYAIGERSADLKISYIKDFGRMSPIVGLVRVHPYMYLDLKHYLGNGTIDELKKFLRSECVSAIGMTEEELRVRAIELSIKRQKESHLYDVKENYMEETPKEDLPEVIPAEMKASGQTLVDKFGSEELMVDISFKPKSNKKKKSAI